MCLPRILRQLLAGKILFHFKNHRNNLKASLITHDTSFFASLRAQKLALVIAIFDLNYTSHSISMQPFITPWAIKERFFNGKLVFEISFFTHDQLTQNRCNFKIWNLTADPNFKAIIKKSKYLFSFMIILIARAKQLQILNVTLSSFIIVHCHFQFSSTNVFAITNMA